MYAVKIPYIESLEQIVFVFKKFNLRSPGAVSPSPLEKYSCRCVFRFVGGRGGRSPVVDEGVGEAAGTDA